MPSDSHHDKSDETRKAVERLFAAMNPVKGEKRVVYRCDDCGHLYGRRFIPYGIGRGLTVDACMCQITAHRPSTKVKERLP